MPRPCPSAAASTKYCLPVGCRNATHANRRCTCLHGHVAHGHVAHLRPARSPPLQVLMVAPTAFVFNDQAAQDNTFMNSAVNSFDPPGGNQGRRGAALGRARVGAVQPSGAQLPPKGAPAGCPRWPAGLSTHSNRGAQPPLPRPMQASRRRR